LEFVKPARLTKNSTVALVSLSWGGPHAFPHVYELGVKNLQKMGLKIKEFATAKAAPDFLYENPRIRADDVNKAFADPEVDGIVSTIGGEDSIRILPYLNGKTIRSNPKIFMGYSDTTTVLGYCNQLGLVTFHGPADKVLGGVTIGFGDNTDKAGRNKADRGFWASMSRATVTIGERLIMKEGRLLQSETR